ncbi:cell wall mannoprotein 1 family protein [Kitasatospora sp. NPDC096140]|uniref:cell wall mannoprotein 1 family protein n=1 Tax=Kitasatospora sp. NPDC096140 TaxID=3155425 RepID=UPI0033332A96
MRIRTTALVAVLLTGGTLATLPAGSATAAGPVSGAAVVLGIAEADGEAGVWDSAVQHFDGSQEQADRILRDMNDLDAVLKADTQEMRDAGPLTVAVEEKAAVSTYTDFAGRVEKSLDGLAKEAPQFQKLGLNGVVANTVKGLQSDTDTFSGTLSSIADANDQGVIKTASASIDDEFKKALSAFS